MKRIFALAAIATLGSTVVATPVSAGENCYRVGRDAHARCGHQDTDCRNRAYKLQQQCYERNLSDQSKKTGTLTKGPGSVRE